MFDVDNILYLNKSNDLNKVKEYLSNLILKDDNKNKHEIFSISIYLVALSKLDVIKYPVEIKKRESPDFQYKDKYIEIGIEHTRATIQQYKIALKKLKKMPNNSFLEPSFYSPFKKISNKNANIGIKGPFDELNGIGWYGDLAEREWAEIIFRIIKSKTYLLNSMNFDKFTINDLFIEDETPVDFIIDIEKGIKFLNNLVSDFYKNNNLKYWDRIHIFSINNLVFDSLGKKIILNLRKKNL